MNWNWGKLKIVRIFVALIFVQHVACCATMLGYIWCICHKVDPKSKIIYINIHLMNKRTDSTVFACLSVCLSVEFLSWEFVIMMRLQLCCLPRFVAVSAFWFHGFIRMRLTLVCCCFYHSQTLLSYTHTHTHTLPSSLQLLQFSTLTESDSFVDL